MELLTLNIFAQSLPFAVIGVALFAGLIALPWWPRRRPHDASAANGQPAFGPVGSLSCPASPGPDQPLRPGCSKRTVPHPSCVGAPPPWRRISQRSLTACLGGARSMPQDSRDACGA